MGEGGEDGWTEGEADILRERETDRQTDKQREKQTETQTVRQTDWLADWKTMLLRYSIHN